MMANVFVENQIHNMYQLRKLNKFMKGHKGFVAGGCFKNLLTNDPVKDVDMFFRNQEDWADAERKFKTDENYAIYYENAKVTAYKHKESGIVIELIRSVFGTPENIIEGFDFSITKFVYYSTQETAPLADDGEERISFSILHHEKFFEHLFFKRLVLEKEIKFPISTFERMVRYSKYGFMPCKESKVNLLNAIRNDTSNEALSLSLYDGLD